MINISAIKHLEAELPKFFTKYGASRNQRDAWYWGFVFGIEIESKKLGIPCKTNFLNDVDIFNLVALRQHTYRFFLKKGFGILEKRHFERGILDGKFATRGY